MFQLRALGGTQVLDSSGGEVRLRSRKHLALLIYLATNPRRVHLRTDLCRLLWDEVSPRSRHSLSQALYDIRSSLGEVVVASQGEGVRALDETFAYDVAELEAAVRQEAWERAAELYSGAFAPELESVATDRFEEWFENQRARIYVLGRIALTNRLEECERDGRWPEVARRALQLIESDPTDEGAHQSLMRALWLQGDRAGAVAHYERISRQEDVFEEGRLSEETLRVAERIQTPPPGFEEDGESGEMPLPLVGRSEEFSLLRSHIKRLEDAGQGGTVVVRGEAGIGKTRLVEELRDFARLSEVPVLWSSCYAAESEVAYGPVLGPLTELSARLRALDTQPPSYRWVGRLLSDWETAEAEPMDDRASVRRQLFEELSDLVRRALRPRPTVWVVEDVQWIDATSASLLHYLSRRLEEEPILFVFTARPAQDADGVSGTALLSERLMSRAALIEVGEMSAEELERMLRGAAVSDFDPSTISKVATLAGGNPFYALEMLRAIETHAADGDLEPERLVTGKLRTLLLSRLRGLSSEALRVLEAISVLGREAAPLRVAKLAGHTPEELAAASEELYARHLIVDRSGRPDFSHDIIREFLYRHTGAVRKAALHQSAGELLAQSDDASSAAVARHFHLAGDRQRAFEFASAAARKAAERAAHEEAVTLADIAIASLSAEDVADVEEMKLLAAEAKRAAGDLSRAMNYLEGVCTNFEFIRSQQIDSLLSLAQIYLELSKLDDFEALLRRITNELIASDQSETERHRVTILIKSLELEAAIRTDYPGNAKKLSAGLRKAYATAEEREVLSFVDRARYARVLAAYYTFYEDSNEADRILEQTRSFRGELSPVLQQRLILLHSVVAIRLAAWDRASAMLTEADGLARSLNDRFYLSAVYNNFGCWAMEQGLWDEGDKYLRKTFDFYGSAPERAVYKLSAMLNLGTFLFFTYKNTEATSILDEVLRLAPSYGFDAIVVEARTILALIALYRGDILEAEGQWSEIREAEQQPRLWGAFHDRYKFNWLKAYMAYRQEPALGIRCLEQGALKHRRLDRVGELKLRWLKDLYSSSSVPETERDPNSLESLRGANLFWFVAFTRRWWERAGVKS